MEFLVLQLARLGDILQTIPAIQGLKKKHPDAKVTLVVRETFADAARLSPHVDNLVEFPSRELLSPQPREQALLKLAQWINENFHLAEPFDTVINLTFSPASSLLASLIPAKRRRGMHCAKDATFMIGDPWSQYFFAQVLGQNLNIIHLNDLFMRIADVGDGTWPVELKEVALPAPLPALEPGRKRVGVQLTASRSHKTLHSRAWITLCERVLNENPEIDLVFFGSSADRSIINNLIILLSSAYATRCHNIAGTMRFHENLAWVKSCNTIISPDTALVHLASLAQTPVIEIVLGGVRPEETGPYGEGHVVIYPVKDDANLLAEEISRVLRGDKAQPVVAQSITRLLKRNDGTQRNELTSRNFTPDAATHFFEQAYYVLAEFRCSGLIEDIEIPKLDGQGQGPAIDRLLQAHDALCSMRRLAEFGQHYCLKMLENFDDRQLLNDLMTKLSETENLLLSLKKAVSLVKPLVDTWSVAKDVAYNPSPNASLEAPGALQLDEVLAVTEGSYRELGQNIEIMEQLLSLTVKAAQKQKTSQRSEKKPRNQTHPKQSPSNAKEAE